MLRRILLYLSTAKWARALVTHLWFARRMARRFVAGETLEEAVAATRTLNQKGMMVSLDLLGENVHTESDAVRATDGYVGTLAAIQTHKLDANVSVKLTALGLDISDDLVLNNMRRLLNKAKEIGTSITIDMEGSAYTERTINIFQKLHQEFDNVCTVIQSYLFRSEGDMQHLASQGAVIRLCKGAYKEPATIAFPKKEEVDANYIKLMRQFMAADNRARGAYLQIATHDQKMIDAALQTVKADNIPADQFEFQMLYGIRAATQQALVQQGYRIRIYVPYGTQWYPYFMRRLAERPANLWFMLKNLFSR